MPWHARGTLLLFLALLLLQRKAAAAAEVTLDAGAAAGGAQTVEVRSERELLAALHDQAVGFITLQRSIRLTKPGGRVQVARNLTISGPVQQSQPGATAAAPAGSLVAIDFAHHSGVLLVSPGVLLTLQHLLLLGSVITWSPGLGCIDHLPGARVRLVRVVRPNPFCPPDPSWLAKGMQSTPVPPGYTPPPELYDEARRGPFTNSMVLWSLAECRAAWLWPDTCQADGGFSQQLAYEMPSQLDNRLVYSYRESMGLYDYFHCYFPCANRVDARCVAARGYPACFNQRNARHIRQTAWADSKGSIATSLLATAATACAAYFWWRRQQQQQQQDLQLERQQQQQQQALQQQQQLSRPPLMRGYVPATPGVLLFQRSADQPLLASVVNCSSSGSLVMNDVTFGSLIGCGSFGRVYKGDVNGQAVAIKVIDMASSSIKTVQQELDVGTHVQHRNLVRCFSYEIRSHKMPAVPNSDGSSSERIAQTTTAASSGVSCGAFDSLSPSSSGAKQQQEQPSQQQQQQEPQHQQQQQQEPQQQQQQQISDRTMAGPVISGGSFLLPDASEPRGHQPLTQVLMLLEYCDGGSLHAAAMAGLLRAGRYNNMTSVLRIALDVARGMQHLHSAKIVHGDLTSNNILLSSSLAVPEPLRYEAKVADFGLSRLLPETGTHLTTAMHGTITHQAPEVLQTGRIRLASDVYSFGVLLWELVHLGTPQQPAADSCGGAHVGSSDGSPVIRGVYQNMVSLHASWLIAQKVVEGMRPEFIAPAVPGPYIALAKRCWSTDPAQRPTFSDIVELLEGHVHGHRDSSSEGYL